MPETKTTKVLVRYDGPGDKLQFWAGVGARATKAKAVALVKRARGRVARLRHRWWMGLVALWHRVCRALGGLWRRLWRAPWER